MILLDLQSPASPRAAPDTVRPIELFGLPHCGLKTPPPQGALCERCEKTAMTGPLADCAESVVEHHMKMVRQAIDRAVASEHGVGGKDDAQVALMRVRQHALAMLCVSA
jgi:hypothetical protein